MAFDFEQVNLDKLDDNDRRDTATGVLDFSKVNLDELEPDNKSALSANLSEAAKLNPAQHAQTTKLSQQSGVPAFAVESNPDEVRQKLDLDKIDLDTMTQKSPGTTKFLSDDFNNAVIAQEDVFSGLLTDIEDTFSGIGESIELGFRTQLAGQVLRSQDKLSEALQSTSDLYSSLGLPETDTDQLKTETDAAINSLTAQIHEQQQKRKELTPEDLGTIQQGVRAGVESLANMVPGVLLTVATRGNTYSLLGTIGVQSYGAAYAEGRDEGLSTEEANYFATIDAAIEVGTELLPVGTLERVITGQSKGLTKEALKFAVQEMSTEQLATALGTLNQVAFGLDEEIENAESISEIVDIQLQRQAVTAIATVVAGGAQITAASAVNKTIEKLTQTEATVESQTEAEQQTIDRLNSQAENSKLKELDNESFKQFIRDIDGDKDTTVYIDGAQTSLYLQSKTDEEIEADPALQLLSNQAREASRLGGDIAIPVADFTGDIAGSEHFAQLRDSMTLSQDSVTPFREEQHRQETETYVDKLLNEAQQNVSEYVESQEIYEKVRSQLVDTGVVSPRNASLMAQVVPAWATAQAQRQGVSVAEVYERSGLTIEGPQTGELSRLEAERALLQSVLDVGDLSQSIRDAHPGVKLTLSGRGGKAVLDKIIVPEDARSTGTGGAVLSEIASWADANGVTVALTPSADFGGSVPRLKKFYKRFGFIENKGRNKDYEISESMYREPSTTLRQSTGDLDGARGYYDPSNSVIRLLDAADLSTFLHEFAHFMYEMEVTGNTGMLQSINGWYKRNADDVAKEATKYLNGDFDVMKQGDRTSESQVSVTPDNVTAYLDDGSTGDKDVDAAVRRAVHEQFARGFETYLMEGKAPSIELRNAFRTFARWLARIYQSLRGDLNVTLDNEMRQVFDALLATEEQIQAAEARARIEPMFTDATIAGMTDQEFSDYQQRHEKVKDVQAETLRDKMIAQITRQTKKWWKDEKRDLVDEELESLSNEQVYVARTRLLEGDIKLDHATVKAMVGEEVTDKLNRKSVRIPTALRGMTAKGQAGMHPDQAAGMLGYQSGSEMLNDLVSAPKIKDQAEINAEARMIDKYGDILTDGTIEQQADEAVQNEERGKLILSELRTLAKGTNQTTLERQAIKSLAEERIGQLSFREIHPGKYRKAEIRAAQESARMLAEGNKEGAASAKLRQALNYYLGMAATDAKTETMKIADGMSRYNKKKVREEIQKAEGGYWEQIVKVLQRFEFRKSATLAQVDRVNQDINTWARERMEIDGDGLVLHNAVLNESYVTHWKNVAYSDLQGINDSVRNIEHVARYANKLSYLGDEISFDKLVTQLVDHIETVNPQKFELPKAIDTTKDKHGLGWTVSQMTNAPWLFTELDGGERVGTVHSAIQAPMNQANADELNLFDESLRVVYDLIENRAPDDRARHNATLYIPELEGTTTGANLKGHQVLATALNVGNESNLRKLLLGEGWANPDTEFDVNMQNVKLQAVLSHMTKSDWQLVQQIWDQMEVLYPQLAEVHRKTTGLVPPKIEATPVETKFGTFNGGYYPVKYDPLRSQKAADTEQKINETTASLFSTSGSIQASVNAGATNERTGFYDPIRLNLDVVPDHFQEVIHFITHHDAIRQSNRLIRDSRFRNSVITRVGLDEYNTLPLWLNDVAKAGKNAPSKTPIDIAFGRLRTGVTLGVMGFKATTGLMQTLGVFNTLAEVGVRNTYKGYKISVSNGYLYNSVRKTLSSEQSMQSGMDFAMEKSKVMPHRIETMDREIGNVFSELTRSAPVEFNKNIAGSALRSFTRSRALRKTQEVSMMHIALIQMYAVDLPSWHAAYQKGMDEWGDDARASEYADFVLENIHGSGAAKDLPSIMRNQSKLTTTFTMFMTFFAAFWGNNRSLLRDVKAGRISATAVAAKVAFLYFIPTLVESLIRGDALPSDDEEPEDALQRYLLKTALYPAQSIPFYRDIVNGATSDYGYTMNPVAGVLEKGVVSSAGLVNAIFDKDKEITKAQVKGTTKLAGAALGIPGVSQVWATGEHLSDVIVAGEDFTVGELLFGPKRDK